MSLEVIEDWGRLCAFEGEWSRFVRESSKSNPFQRPEWLMTWWRHFGSGALRVMVFREEGKVVGVLPCFVHEWAGRRQVTLMGTGVSDYLDPLIEYECAAQVRERVCEELRRRSDWDICDWQDLLEETPLAGLGNVGQETPCSAVAMEATFEEYLGARQSILRRNLRRSRTKAEAIGRVEFAATESADAELMDALVRLHGARWAEVGQTGMIVANGSEAFLREVSVALAAQGLLRIFTLRFHGRVAALILAFCDRTTVYGYLSAFDPEYEAFSFGRELLAQALRYAHERGYCRWDFLRGEEDYKFLWGAQVIRKSRLRICS